MAAPRTASTKSTKPKQAAANSTAAASPFAEQNLPPPEQLHARAADPDQARAREFLRILADQPPQVMLLEGGEALSRLSLALWWMALTQCRGPAVPKKPKQETGSLLMALAPSEPEPQPEPPKPVDRPCLSCDACAQVFTGVHNDLHLLNGAEDLIKIADVRDIILKLSEAPRHGGQRCIILHEAHNCRAETANALLKSLEEPRPGNTFFLLTPQRERLLPTLVSRSLTLSLAWPDPHQPPRRLAEDATLGEAISSWMQRLEGMAVTGRGWFDGAGGKSALDKPTAQALLLECQRRLAEALRGDGRGCFANMNAPALHRVDAILADAHSSLEYFVTPALVLDWVATQLRVMLQK